MLTIHKEEFCTAKGTQFRKRIVSFDFSKKVFKCKGCSKKWAFLNENEVYDTE